MFLTVNKDVLTMLMTSLARDASALGSIEVEVEGGNRKRSEQSMNADHKSLETVFSIAICCQSDDKRQSKIMFLTILDLCSSIVRITFSIAPYLKCLLNICLLNT